MQALHAAFPPLEEVRRAWVAGSTPRHCR